MMSSPVAVAVDAKTEQTQMVSSPVDVAAKTEKTQMVLSSSNASTDLSMEAAEDSSCETREKSEGELEESFGHGENL